VIQPGGSVRDADVLPPPIAWTGHGVYRHAAFPALRFLTVFLPMVNLF